MKKAYNSKRKYCIFLGLLSICLIFLNTACGLDELDAVLDDPFSTEEAPPNIEAEYEKRHFSFTTKTLDNANDFGKSYIYYKIYNNVSTMNSEVGVIDGMINDTVRKYNSALTLLDNYSYKELYCASSYGNVSNAEQFVLSNNAQHTVRIRLTNYDETVDDYSAKIIVDGTERGIPFRFNYKSFDFGRNNPSYDEKPVKAETDERNSDTRNFSDPTADGVDANYYVVLYGLFSMPTDTFEKTIYSPVHYLGAVKIDSNELNN